MHFVRTITTSLLGLAFAAAPLAAAPVADARDKGAGLGQEQVKLDNNTEQIIKGALKYLASKQNGNGSWATGSGEQQEVAMTGYVLVAFLAAGQLPDEGEFGKNVTSGMNYLLNMVRPDGTMGRHGHYMYGHGIASIALAEIYGQTRDPRMRPKLEQVIKLIIQSQNREGGWRYNPGATDADISVTVLQVVALRAAKNAGLEVPQQVIDRAVNYVRTCHNERSGGFTYQPRNNDPGFARTAAAIYSLQVCGQYDDPRVKASVTYLHKNKTDRQWFTYGHFYAAPAMYMVGGDDWKNWYTEMSKMLLEKVKHQGDMAYWEPHWDGGRGVGPVYCTAVYSMILSMPYHYLPLYQR